VLFRSMKGILFKVEMVRAILDNRKKQTRRVIKRECELDPRNLKYQPGEIVYVKETYLIDEVDGIYYRADAEKMEDYDPSECKWKSAMFMPEKFSRIHLKITAVRVERLQEIDCNDAFAEGTPDKRTMQNNYDLRDCYHILWNSINKPPYSWSDNPFVAVYIFERTDTAETR